MATENISVEAEKPTEPNEEVSLENEVAEPEVEETLDDEMGTDETENDTDSEEEPLKDGEDITEEAEEVADEKPVEEAVEPQEVKEDAEEEPQEDIWKQQYEELQKNTKKALKALGIEIGDNDTAEDAIDKAQAEFEGVTLEEYRAKKTESETLEKAKEIVKQQKFEQLCAQDLLELKKAFPQLLELKHLREIGSTEEFKRFGELRDKDISVKEAYLAVMGDKIVNSKELLAKQQAIKDSKAHLKSVAPTKNYAPVQRMEATELSIWRGYFPNKTDSEIAKIYFAEKK